MSLSKEPGEISGKSKKNTSLRLDGKTLKALKIRAIKGRTSVQKIIETLVTTILRHRKRVCLDGAN